MTSPANTVTSRYDHIQQVLRAEPRTWLVTGVAGFIGSHLLETLLKLDQRVVGLDNFATGYQHNLDDVQRMVTPAQWARFEFVRGDIRNLDDCRRAMQHHAAGEGSPPVTVDYVLHEAALGSVPRSIEDPIATNAANIDGFLNMLVAARDARVKSFTYAASSSTYGDHPGLPKVEDRIGKPLSPYAVTKYVNELYADVFARCYGFNTIGLRYFNVFGPRQDPNGAYAAVIPKWIAALIKGEPVYINGDGETSRDFCYVANAVQANLLAATVSSIPPRPNSDDYVMPEGGPAAVNQVYNVAVGDRTTLNELFRMLRDALVPQGADPNAQPVYRDFRAGDVRHSQADVRKAEGMLAYRAEISLARGVAYAPNWVSRNSAMT